MEDVFRMYVERALQTIDNSSQKQTVINNLVLSYTSEDRFYHNTFHIIDMVINLDLYRTEMASKYKLLLLAIIYHDVIYYNGTVNDKSCEYTSAERAYNELKTLGLSDDDLSYITNLIMATEYRNTMNDRYCNINKGNFPNTNNIDSLRSDIDTIRDLDFAGFASYRFLDAIMNGANVVKEYLNFGVPKDDVLKGRIAFLESIDVDKLFLTEKGKEQFTAKAKFNISTELDLLKFKGLSIYDNIDTVYDNINR